MGGQRAEDERDGAGIGLDEADSLRGGSFVGDEVSGGGVAGGVGGGVGARTAARTGTATETETETEVDVAEGAVASASIPASTAETVPTVPAASSVPAVPAAASEPGSVPADPGGSKSSAAPDAEPADLTDSQIVGRRLALARRHAGLSIDDVVAATRIRPGMLREIEAGDFVHCGGDVYARGHVRAIAKVVGIDPEPLLAGHPPFVPTDLPVRGRARVVPRAEVAKAADAGDGEKDGAPEKRPGTPGSSASASSASASNAVPTSAARDNAARYAGRAPSRVIRPAAEGSTLIAQIKGTGVVTTKNGDAATVIAVAGQGGGSGSVRPPQPRGKNDPGKIERHPKSANWTAAMLVALLGLVVFAGVQLIDDGGGKPAAAAAPVVPAHKPAAVKPAAPVPPPAPKGVAVRFAAVGSDSWLYVTGPDGKVLFDNLLPAGSSQNFQDPKQLGVTFGNAAAVHMTLNGKDLAPAGGTGQVVHVTLNPTGMTTG
jgi:hypothetical protein